MVIKKEDSLKKVNSDTCVVYEFNYTKCRTMQMCYAEIDGRYPEVGWCVNEICDETYLINSGRGKINLEGEILEFYAGDVVYILAGKKFYCEADNIKFWCPTSLPFFKGQHKYIEK